MSDTAPRYFHIRTDDTTPTWTIIAARPSDAWRLWVNHEDASGFLDDDGTRRPLTECAIGSVFCSEY